MVSSKYSQLSPEAIRGLLIHSCNWTPAMVRQCTDAHGDVDQEMLLRCYGYGVPNIRELLSSADNSLTLIAQGEIQPFYLRDDEVKTREMCLHELPWPRDTLEELGAVEVQMRVTLSYFIEPNPAARGWSTKYSYQSHGLRFDVKRARESVDRFRKSINKAAREGGYDENRQKETGRWRFPISSSLAALGSVRSNVWTGHAADLAARGFIAVYPTYGWWNKRPNLKGYEKSSRYALIVTITTPETNIYTPVANSIDVPVMVEA
jgi:hypothetical protein